MIHFVVKPSSQQTRNNHLSIFILSTEALLRALRQSLEISQPLLAPELLLAPAVGGEFLAKTG